MTASPADLDAFQHYLAARKWAGAADAVAVTGADLRAMEREELSTASVQQRIYLGQEIVLLTGGDWEAVETQESPAATFVAQHRHVLDWYVGFAAPHHAVTWATRETAVSYTSDPPTSSPFQTIDERRSEADKVSELIELIRSSAELPFAERLARRLEELVDIAREEAPDQSEMSSNSLRAFMRLLRDHPDLSEPGVVLTPSGNILAEWRAAPNKLCAAEFVSDARVNYVVFAPNTRDPHETSRITGVGLPVESLLSAIQPHGADAWMRT